MLELCIREQRQLVQDPLAIWEDVGRQSQHFVGSDLHVILLQHLIHDKPVEPSVRLFDGKLRL